MKRVVALLILLTSHAAISQQLDLGINFVNVDSLNVRELPNSNSKVVGKKIFRQGVDVLEYQDDWAKINFYNEGKMSMKWISASYLVKTRPDNKKNKYELNAIKEQIPRSSNEKAGYFLLYTEVVNGNFITLHERTSSTSTGYTKTEFNCNTKQYRVLGYTERHIENIYFDDTPTNWAYSRQGSSKYDLINYVCSTKR